MKKRDLTLDKKIGIYGLGLLVFLVICGSQAVLAAALTDISNTVTLNVNAGTPTQAARSTAKINQFTYYTSPAGLMQNVTVPWTEKALYGSVITAPAATPTTSTATDAEIKLTVTTKAKGDLIIKVDKMTVTTNSVIGATTGSGLVVETTWLRYAYNAAELSGTTTKTIELVRNGYAPSGAYGVDGVTPPVEVTNDITVSQATALASMCLETQLAASANGATITMLNYFTKLKMSSQIIFTAIMVDNVQNLNPQVIGVDVKTIFFNYVNPITLRADYRPIWLDLIMAGDSVGWSPS